MRAPVVVEADPIADPRLACWKLSKRWRWMHCSLIVRMTRSTMPFCCGQCGVMNSCRKPSSGPARCSRDW